MQKTATKARSSNSYVRPALQKSTTLSRKYVRRPTATKKFADVKRVDNKKTVKVVAVPEKKTEKAETKATTKATVKAEPEATTPKITKFRKPASQKAETPKSVAPKIAKSPKTKAANTAASDAAREAMRGLATAGETRPMKRRRARRILLAFTCSAIVVAILGVFVAVNMPNISVKVAALQTGIEAAYPNYVPRNYNYETVASDKDGQVTMKFVGPDDAYFILTEEKSAWDSTAVLNNFVKSNYSGNYSTMHEQGITYYTEAGSAVWVNGGILYKISSYGKNLSKEQIRNLVVSL